MVQNNRVDIKYTGPRGPKGDTGPVGPGGGGTRIVYPFPSPAATWIVNHNLNCYPLASAIDDNGEVVEPDIIYNSANSISFVFAVPATGKVII